MSAFAVIVRAALVVALVLAAACRPGEGQRCVCEGECRRGLVCAQGGRLLKDEECVEPGDPTPGECVEPEADELPDMVADEGVQPDFIYHDLGGKRDFEPGRPPEDEGTMESSTTQASTTTTDATTTGAPSTTTTSTGTSSSSTGAP